MTGPDGRRDSFDGASGPAPLVPDVGVIGLVPEAWGDVWMPRHHIMSRLARYYNVLWMEPPVGWRTAWLRQSHLERQLNPRVPEHRGFRVLPPSRRFPAVYRPRFAADLMRRLRVREAAGRLHAIGARRIVLYIWRPAFDHALGAVPHAVSCYHVDDEYSFSTVERPVDDRERRLLGQVDRVFLHSPGLWEKKAALASHASAVPNGVDFEAFSTPKPEPADLAPIPRPRVGYIGVVKHMLDFPLLLEVARRRPSCSFVLVGPVKPLGPDSDAFNQLQALPNVHVLGARPVYDLPAYAQHLDAALMPYDLDGYTKFIYPMKLHEYLAAGIPIVGTGIRTLQSFGSVVSLATGPEEWTTALDRALSAESRAPAAVEARRRIARRFDWDRITHRVARILAEALGPDILQTVEAASFASSDWSEWGDLLPASVSADHDFVRLRPP